MGLRLTTKPLLSASVVTVGGSSLETAISVLVAGRLQVSSKMGFGSLAKLTTSQATTPIASPSSAARRNLGEMSMRYRRSGKRASRRGNGGGATVGRNSVVRRRRTQFPDECAA